MKDVVVPNTKARSHKESRIYYPQIGTNSHGYRLMQARCLRSHFCLILRDNEYGIINPVTLVTLSGAKNLFIL